MTSDPDVQAWRSAAADPAVAAALESLYADVAAEIAARGPTCWTSGRCCNFESYGHRLYTTGLETAYTLAKLPELAPPTAVSDSALPVLSAPAMMPPQPLTQTSLDDALARGGCPFQAATLCGVHPIRPLGCRVYFCDPSAQGWQNELYEQALARLRRLHDDHAVPYRYLEWRAALQLFLDGPR